MITKWSVLDGEEHTLYMPYGTGTSRSHGCDGINNGYIDLETQPERIDEIHELRKYPELRRSVEIILEGKTFRSIRSDACPDQHKERNFKHSMFSILTVAFKRPVDDVVSKYEGYRANLQSRIEERGLSGDRAGVFFVAAPVIYRFTGERSYTLDLRVITLGHTPADARGRWIASMRFVNESLEEWSNGG